MLRYLRERQHYSRLGQVAFHNPPRGRLPWLVPDLMTESIDQLVEMNINHANDCCNKTAPFYVFKVSSWQGSYLIEWLHKEWPIP